MRSRMQQGLPLGFICQSTLELWMHCTVLIAVSKCNNCQVSQAFTRCTEVAIRPSLGMERVDRVGLWRRGFKLARPWCAKGLRAYRRKFSCVLERAADYSCDYSAIGSSITVQGYFSHYPQGSQPQRAGLERDEPRDVTRAPCRYYQFVLASFCRGRKQASRKLASSTSPTSSTSSLTRGCGSLNRRRITQTIHHTKVGVAQPLNSSLAGFFFPFNQRTHSLHTRMSV
jgi:hypothetical protein